VRACVRVRGGAKTTGGGGGQVLPRGVVRRGQLLLPAARARGRPQVLPAGAAGASGALFCSSSHPVLCLHHPSLPHCPALTPFSSLPPRLPPIVPHPLAPLCLTLTHTPTPPLVRLRDYSRFPPAGGPVVHLRAHAMRPRVRQQRGSGQGRAGLPPVPAARRPTLQRLVRRA